MHRPGRGDTEIFRFYRGVKKSQKAWALPKDSDAVFSNLDQPHVKKRVVLLVAIGTEGWDCKSLTAVALPRRETTKNFVLQTTCRCLREVVSAKDETALIALGESNYETLDKELKENYALSIANLRVHAEETVNVLLRKPKLGRLRFKNVHRRYSIIREQRDRDVAAQLASFDFGMFRTEYRFTPMATEAAVGQGGLADVVTRVLAAESARHRLAYGDFLSALARATWGRYSEADLVCAHDAALRGIHEQIRSQIGWLALHPAISLDDVVAFAAALLMENIRVTHDEIEEDVEIDLLDWRMDPPPAIPHLAGRQVSRGRGRQRLLPPLGNSEKRNRKLMIPQPYKPLPYTIAPARGQALLSFAGRRMPDHLPLFEVAKVEEVHAGDAPLFAGDAPAAEPNLLLHGDCLSACAYLKAKNIKVDLVYIDPPFASGANYAKKIFLRNGGNATLEGEDNSIAEEVMYGDIWQKEDYLNWLYERLLAIREVMNESGAIYIHLDWHIGHYVKVLCDESVQFDTTLREDGVWVSNPALEDKAGPKEKIKGRYTVMARAFKVKFRNIAGDEITLEFPAPSVP